MFFRKKKEPPAPTPPPPGAATDAASSQIWSGNTNVDRRRFEALLSSIAEVSQTIDLETLLTHIVDISIDHTGAERGFLILSEPGADGRSELTVRVARMRGKKAVPGEVRFARTIVRKVLDSREPVRATVNSDSEALDLGTSVFDLKLRAVMCVPLVARARPGGEAQNGVLYVDSKAATREFKPEDLALFAALSQHISIALENARLHLDSLERAKLDQSLEIASQIQQGLMPPIPEDVPGYDVFAWYRPAERTSGDFYEVVCTKNGRLGVALGDATGHGIGPALITATAQAQLRAYMRMMADPGAIVSLVNQDLGPRMDDGLFLTLFVAVFAPDGTLSTLNAGQTPPLLWRARTGAFETIRADGPALGMMDDFEYTSRDAIQLESGDVLLAVTDGFVEARSAKNADELFGESGVKAVLERAVSAGASSKAITEALVNAALEFAGGKRDDDMTVVVIRRKA